jgi:pyruvate dehydrogenase E1 component alpha subunit
MAGALALFERMLRIRRFEEDVIRLAQAHDYVGRQHLYIGAEASAAAVCALLGAQDVLFTTHRNHGYLVGRGADPARMFAEILGRESGTNRGRGGPWHIADATIGVPSTSAMVGGSIGLAVGSGFAFRRLRRPAISVAHFGDGTLDEGIAYEALNIASLWKLPVLFMCENNSKPGQRPSSMLAAKHLSHVPAALDIPTLTVDGADVLAMFEAVGTALRHVRSGAGPFFLQADLERWPGSHQVEAQFPTGVTDIAMAWDEAKISGRHADWIRHHDPVRRHAKRIVDSDPAARETLLSIDRRVRAEMAPARDQAERAPFPSGIEGGDAPVREAHHHA